MARKKKSNAGAPSKLTPEVIEDVRRLLPTCMYQETVCQYLGIDRVTWRDWLKRAATEKRRIKRGGKPSPDECLYVEFSNAVQKALAEGEICDAGVIKKASLEQWQAAAWRLERRFPERWGRREQHQLSGPNGGPIQSQAVVVNWDAMTVAKPVVDPIEERIKALEAREAENAGTEPETG